MGVQRSIIIGKHTGAHSIKQKLMEYGVELTDEQIATVLEKIKKLADSGKHVDDAELVALAYHLIGQREARMIKLKEFAVFTGVNITPTAVVAIEVNGEKKTGIVDRHRAGGRGPERHQVVMGKDSIPGGISPQRHHWRERRPVRGERQGDHERRREGDVHRQERSARTSSRPAWTPPSRRSTGCTAEEGVISMSNAKTISEKILSNKSDTDARAGEIVEAEVDYVMVNDVTAPLAFKEFEALGCEPMREKIVLIPDHFVPEQGHRLGRAGRGDAAFRQELADPELLRGRHGAAYATR